MPFPDPNHNPTIPIGGVTRMIPGMAGLLNILQNGAGDAGGAAFSGLGGLLHGATGLGVSQAPTDGGPSGPFHINPQGTNPAGGLITALENSPIPGIGGLTKSMADPNNNPQGQTNNSQWDPNFRYTQQPGENIGNFRNKAWNQAMYQYGGINPYSATQTPFSSYVQGQAGLMGQRFDIANALKGSNSDNEADSRSGYLSSRLQGGPNMSLDDMNRSFGGLRDIAGAQARGDTFSGNDSARQLGAALNDPTNPTAGIQAIESLLHGHGNSSYESYDNDLLQRKAQQYQQDPTIGRNMGASPSFGQYLLSQIGR